MGNSRLVVLAGFILALSMLGDARSSVSGPVSHCADSEQVVFSCALKQSQKLLSLCSSKELTKTSGYMQYRFGLPGKVELEFPQHREDSLKSFQYSHYFRAQVDLTEISFVSGDFQYTVFDDYNGEEKPSVSRQGVRVIPTSGGKEVTLLCATKARANFASLSDVLVNKSEPQ